jgi:RimJ/RimL family protein N-acetyltransferase
VTLRSDFVFLETERLRLRRFTAEDVELLVELDSDPEVMRFLSGGAATPRAFIETAVLPRFVASYAKYGGLGWWAAEDRANGEFVGWFGLHPSGRDGEMELGYRLQRAAWNRGLATEGSLVLLRVAFERGADRVMAQTYEKNVASRRVMEKIGMRFVRAFRVASSDEMAGTFDAASAAAFDGDDVEYAIERREWERQVL